MKNSSRHKIIALTLLSLQSSLLILTMRYTKMRGLNYSTSVAIFCSEVLKIMICILCSWKSEGLRRTLLLTVSGGHWKLAVPATFYAIQNHLQYFAASKLDASTLQVAYQLKILTTAVFFVLFMHKNLRLYQWGALILLTVGVIIMQFSPKDTNNNKTIGFLVVVVICTLSGAASVYFEKCVKQYDEISVWVRNLQLGLHSIIPLMLVGFLENDITQTLSGGLFYGFDWTVFTVILLQAAGGIIVANVIKHANSVLKNFATSISILLSTCLSCALWSSPITLEHILGGSLVIIATFLFNN